MENMENIYSANFVEALEYCKQNNLYLGEGNPNAKILIIGKESGLNAEDRSCFQKSNSEFDWIVDFSKNTAKNNINSLKNNYLQNGLSKLKNDIPYNLTWSNYQRLVSLIYGIKEQDIPRGGKGNWEFLNKCFITELSQIRLPKSNYLGKKGIPDFIKRESIKERAKLFHLSFFRQFPIVIIASGPDYIDSGKYKYDFNIQRDFAIKYIKTVDLKEDNVKKRWYNIHKDNNARIIIHTRQLSVQREPNRSLYKLINAIAQECKEFI